MDPEIAQLFAEAGGLVRRRDHPKLAARLDRLIVAGKIGSPLPGVLAVGELVSPEQRIAAGLLWTGPNTVVAGLAAARLSFWPDCRVEVIELHCQGRAKRARPGWVVIERTPPPELVVQRGHLRFTCPALTAVDLASGPLGGEVIDRVLRTRSASLTQLKRALELTPGRRGNVRRAALLDDSRDEPWSEAERELHRLLRAAGILGWRGNQVLRVQGCTYVPDVCFERQRLVIEVDGFADHGGRDAFEADRRRRNALVLAGYVVLNFTWRQIVDDPGWVVDCVLRALGAQ